MGVSILYQIFSCLKQPRSQRHTIWCYSQGDFERAGELLCETDWEKVIDNNASIDENWDSWQSTFLEVMNECIPQKTLGTQKHLPWISTNHVQLFRRHNSLLRTCRYNRTHKIDVLFSRDAKNGLKQVDDIYYNVCQNSYFRLIILLVLGSS